MSKLCINKHRHSNPALGKTPPQRGRMELKEDQDFFGSAVVVAVRIMALATGRQILVSGLFRKLAGTTGSRFRYLDRGWTHLKGFATKEHLYEIDWRSDNHTGFNKTRDLPYSLRQKPSGF